MVWYQRALVDVLVIPHLTQKNKKNVRCISGARVLTSDEYRNMVTAKMEAARLLEEQKEEKRQARQKKNQEREEQKHFSLQFNTNFWIYYWEQKRYPNKAKRTHNLSFFLKNVDYNLRTVHFVKESNFFVYLQLRFSSNQSSKQLISIRVTGFLDLIYRT